MQVIEALKQSASQFSNPDSNLGYGIPNMPVACQILASLSVSENDLKDQLLIGQNPFTTSLEFIFFTAQSNSIQVMLTDIYGKIVYSNSFSVIPKLPRSFSIQPEISSGIYFLSILTVNGSAISKVIKL